MNNNQDISTSHPEDIAVENHQNSISTQISDIQQPSEEINTNLDLLKNDEQDQEQVENQQTIQAELNSQLLIEAEQNKEQENNQLINPENAEFPIQEEQTILNVTKIEKEKMFVVDQYEETEEENILNRQEQADHLQYLANQKTLIEGMTLEQKEQLMDGDILRQLTQRLQWSHKKLPIHARPVQDAICDLFNLLVEGIKNFPYILLKSQIIKELMIFIGEDIPAEEVKLVHIQGIPHLTENGFNYQYIFNIGLDKSVAKVLKSTDQEVVEAAVRIILKIINNEIRDDKINLNQLCTVLERDGVIHALCQDILMREEIKEKLKNDVAILLGSLFTKEKMSQQIRQAVIIQLKKGIIYEDEDILKKSFSLLDSLSQIQGNHLLILSNNFLPNLVQFLRTNKDEIIRYSLRLINTLLEFGTDTTKEEVVNIIPLDILQQQRNSSNVYNQQLAKMINSWIRQRNKMLKIAEINKQIQLGNEDQISILIEQGVFKVIYAIDELMKEEDNNDGVILFACQTLIKLSNYNQQLIQENLKDYKFVDQIFKLLHALPLDQIMPIHIECLHKIVFNNSFFIVNFNNCENRIMEIWNIILNSQNEEVLEIVINQIKQQIQSKIYQLKYGQPHPYRAAFITNGTVARFVHLLQQQNIKNIKIKSNLAIILGSIFKSVPIPKEFRSVVINQLKNIEAEDNLLNINNQLMNVGLRNNLINDEKLQVLACLAECKSNLEEIFSNQFIQTIALKIKGDNNQTIQDAFKFFYQVFRLSNTKIKAELNAEIETLQNSKNGEIRYQAIYFYWNFEISSSNQNKQEQIKEKQERMKIIFSRLNQTDIPKPLIVFSIGEFEKKFESIKLLNRNNDYLRDEGLKLGIFDEIENLMSKIIIELQQKIMKEDGVIENENNEEKGKYEIIKEIYEKIMIFFSGDFVWSQQTASLLMKSQIPKQMILLFQLLPLDDICLTHVLALSQLFIWTNNEEKLQLFELGVIDSMILILESSNDTIFDCSTFIIHSINKVLKQSNLVNELSDMIISIFSKIDQYEDKSVHQEYESQWYKCIKFLQSIIQFAPHQAKIQLYESGIIQQLTNINNYEFEQYFQKIITYILMGGADLVHEGQQHPWFNDLESDGTIQKLINKRCNNCICLLYKAKILPPAIGVGIIQEIMEETTYAPYHNSQDISLTVLCSLVESNENHEIIVNHESFIKMINHKSFKADSQTYLQLIKLLDILSHNGTDKIKQQIWDILPTSFRVQIPSIVKFHQESKKKNHEYIQNIPSQLLIEFATNKEFAQNKDQRSINFDPTDISSLFIEILVLLDFFNRHTSKNQQYICNQTNISPWLETRLRLHIFFIYISESDLFFIVLLSHSLVLSLKYFKQNRQQNDSITPENNNLMNAITLIEDLLMKCNSHPNQNINEKLRNFIANIKERMKQGEIIQLRNLFWWQTAEQEQFNESKTDSGNNNRRVELCLEEHNEIIIGLVEHIEKEKVEQISESLENPNQISNDIQKLATSSFQSDHDQSQTVNNSTVISQKFKIDNEFGSNKPINFLEEVNQSQKQQLELQSNNESISENEQIVYGLRRILMKEKERSQLEEEELEWACEASIPYLVLILKQYADRFNHTKMMQMRKYEKDALLILAHIVLKGAINKKVEQEELKKQNNIFQVQFELQGLANVIEIIANIHKSEECVNENMNKVVISENNYPLMMNELEKQINILNLYLKSLQNNINWRNQYIFQFNNETDFDEEEKVAKNTDNKSVLEQIIQYLKNFIKYYNYQQNISNQKILKDTNKDDEVLVFARICISLLIDHLIGMNNIYTFINQNKKSEIFSILVQIIHLSIPKSVSYFLFQNNAIKCLSILLRNNSHLASLKDLRNFINIINSNISEAISTPNNFILTHCAVSSLHLLIALDFNQHQNQQIILDYNYGQSLTLLTQRSRSSLINSSTSEAIRELCIRVSPQRYALFGDNIKMKLFLQCKFGQILSLWMCNAGGEEQRDDVITETMNQLQRRAYYFNDKYNKDKEDRLIDQSDLQNNALIMKKEFEEEMEEEGIEDECEANIHSYKEKFKREADQLKREIKQLQNQQQMR